MEHEFNDTHKDSFVRSPKQDASKPPAQPAGAQGQAAPPAAPAAPAAPKPPVRQGAEQLDDFIPDKVGNVVDNVFGKLDNLVNDAADYLFGNKKKGGGLLEGDNFSKTQAPSAVPPLIKTPQAPPPIPKPEVKPLITPQAPVGAAAAPPAIKNTQVRTLSTLQASKKPEMIRPVMPESRSKAPKFDGPIITRTTSISELDLPLEILDDPDLPKYFDQMKLYEPQVVTGGFCNLPQFEASMALRRGKWKKDFTIRFEDLKKIEPGIYPMEMAKSRFFGMRPVYKAQAYRFSNAEALVAAIETDINSYLTGKQGKGFHPFIYQVVSTIIR